MKEIKWWPKKYKSEKEWLDSEECKKNRLKMIEVNKEAIELALKKYPVIKKEK